MYQVFLVIHIVAAGLWFADLAAWLAFNRLLASQNDRSATIALQIARIRLAGLNGMIAALGIFISGFGLIGMAGQGFLGLWGENNGTWLIVKQAIFLVIIVLSFALLMPASVRLRKQLTAAMGTSGAISDEARALFSRVNLFGVIVSLLVLVNIILGVFKPV